MYQLTPHGALRRTTPKTVTTYATQITGTPPLPAPSSEVRYYCKTCKAYYTLRDPNAVNPHGSHDYEYSPTWTLNV